MFDEAEWALTVDGRPVRTEAKPLELLRALLLRPGNVVSKDELLDLIWPDVTVVEASLPTAVHKLRLALGDDRRPCSLIKTVPGIGYRLAVPVTIELIADAALTPPAIAPSRRSFRLLTFGILASAFCVAGALLMMSKAGARSAVLTHRQRAELATIRRMDLPEIERLLDHGWNPDAVYGAEGNNALNALIENCEWDPGHDRRKMLIIARTLLDSGAQYSRRNVWGDTAYSIAKAKRYCGPDHPVTVMLRRLCVDNEGKGGDRCMASYALSRGEHFPG